MAAISENPPPEAKLEIASSCTAVAHVREQHAAGARDHQAIRTGSTKGNGGREVGKLSTRSTQASLVIGTIAVGAPEQVAVVFHQARVPAVMLLAWKVHETV